MSQKLNRSSLNYRKVKFYYILRWVILFISITYIGWFFWNSKAELKLAFYLSPSQIITVIVLIIIYLFLHGLRFKMILEKCGGQRLGMLAWFQIFILGRIFNQFIPQFGNMYRSIMLKTEFNVAYTHYIIGFLSYAWMDTIFNFVFASTIIFILTPNLQLFGFNAALYMFIIGLILFIFPLIIHKIFTSFTFNYSKVIWFYTKTKDILKLSISNLMDFSYLLRFIVLTIMTFSILVSLFYLLFCGFGSPLDLGQLTLFYVLRKLSTFVNITPANLGLQELAYGALSSEVEAGMAIGIMVSVAIRILHFSVLLILGLAIGAFKILRWYNK